MKLMTYPEARDLAQAKCARTGLPVAVLQRRNAAECRYEAAVSHDTKWLGIGADSSEQITRNEGEGLVTLFYPTGPGQTGKVHFVRRQAQSVELLVALEELRELAIRELEDKG